MVRREELTDEQWAILEPLIPPLPRRPDGKGRPWRDNREVLHGILSRPADRGSVERPAGAVSPVPDLPPSIPAMGAGRNLAPGPGGLSRRPSPARGLGPLGMFRRWHLCGGEKRGLGVGKTKRGKGTKLMAVADGSGLPIAVHTASAAPHEVTLLEETLSSILTTQLPERLIGDKAYDSDPLDEALARQGIEMIAPHRSNRRKSPTQDGRSLRRYCRRWKVERLFAWLHNFRRVVVRYERHIENFLGFVHLACILILLRCYL